MVLRRPTLLFCILTIVLGVHYEIRTPSPADASSLRNSIMAMVTAGLNHNTDMFAGLVCKKRHRPVTLEILTEHSGPMRPLEDEAVRSRGEESSSEADTRLGRKPSAHGSDQDELSTCCDVPEDQNGIRYLTSSSLFLFSRWQQSSKHVESESTSLHQSQPSTSSIRKGMICHLPFLTAKHLRCPLEKRSIQNTLPLASPLSTRTTSATAKYGSQSSQIPRNQSEDSGQKTVADENSHDDEQRHSNSHTSLSVAHHDRCFQERFSSPAKSLKSFSDRGIFRLFDKPRKLKSERKVHPEISALRPQDEDGYFWVHAKNVHNLSIPEVLENCEMQFMKKTATREREMTLFCLCITLLIFRNEDLRQVMAPLLFGIKEMTNIRQLMEELLQRITENNGSNRLSLQDGLDNPPPDGLTEGLKKGKAHGLFDAGGKSAHVSELSHSRFQGTCGSAEGAKAEKTYPLRAARWLTTFRASVPRRVLTLFTAPASFFPSMGSSAKDAMSHLGCRLASLSALPPSCKVSRVRLAQSGFYYDNSKTQRSATDIHEVTCYSCGVSYSQWKDGDSPDTIHQQLRPHCHHLKEITPTPTPSNTTTRESSMSTNESVSMAPSSGFWSMTAESLGSRSMSSHQTDSVDTCPPASAQADSAGVSGGRPASASAATSNAGNQLSSAPRTDAALIRNGCGDLATDCAAIVPSAVTSANQATSRPDRVNAPLSSHSSLLGSGDLSSARGHDLEDRPLLSMNDAVYPQFSRMQDRRATFANWPLSHYFHPDELVLHGFYYAGYADCIRCFYCGVGLKSWCRDDDVMQEHIRWRPSCGYILNTKGRQFVNSIVQRIQASASGNQSNPTGRQNQAGNETVATASRQTAPPSTNSAATQTSSVCSASSNTPASNGTAHTSPAPVTSSTATSASSTTRSSASAGSAGVASAPAPTGSVAVPASARNGGSAGRELLKTVEEMGFDHDTTARAVRQLQQEGVATIGVEALVNKILEISPERDERIGGNAARQSGDLHTDDAEEDSDASAADYTRSQWLASENARLRDRNKCRICKDAKVGMIFLPCGHILACAECGSKIRHCSQCGEFIKATANVYI